MRLALTIQLGHLRLSVFIQCIVCCMQLVYAVYIVKSIVLCVMYLYPNNTMHTGYQFCNFLQRTLGIINILPFLQIVPFLRTIGHRFYLKVMLYLCKSIIDHTKRGSFSTNLAIIDIWCNDNCSRMLVSKLVPGIIPATQWLSSCVK